MAASNIQQLGQENYLSTNMYALLRFFDTQLNRLTMYQVVLQGLRLLLIAAFGLALIGAIGINAGALVASYLVLAVSCYAANYAFAKFFKAPFNFESASITALILTCIITPRLSVSILLLSALTGALAMSSKYLLTWRGSHIFNPAAAGAVIVSVTGLLSIGWWIASPWLTPFTILLAIVVLRKQRKFTLFFAFAITAVIVLLFVTLGQHQAVGAVLRSAIFSWPIIFLGSIMLTEPTTVPTGRYYQVSTAIIVGLIFACQQHIGPIASTPHVALVVGNLFAAVMSPPFGAMVRLKRRRQLAPDITELTYEKPKNFKYLAGQYMEWTLPHPKIDKRGNRRTFSLASAPDEEDLIVTVRTYDKSSSFKQALTTLKEGQQIRIANLDGEFILPLEQKPLLFIAGGIGITPFRSQIAQLIAHNEKRDIELLYLASRPEHFVYRELFKQASKNGVKAQYGIGRLTVQELTKKIPDIKEREIYISGPDQMVRDYKRLISGAGLPKRRIHTDYFSGY